MSQFESKIKVISYNQERVYAKLSDLNNLQALKDRMPADKIKNLNFDSDSLSFDASPVGEIRLKIVDKVEPKTIKFETVKSPIPFNLWIQLVETGEEECKLKLTVRIDINPFMKGMIQKPLQEGLEKMAETLAVIQY
ncbi:SRPBCC family protein [uncultured Bacteroides sp.]|uniref:SRPBCC family protein n=1 Tax=uncultured Bacteroides sp. TaxID=162156 RepID=UPI002AAC4114|nr:SRPBCC family protein [uncultured Bacteroides sp.]